MAVHFKKLIKIAVVVILMIFSFNQDSIRSKRGYCLYKKWL